MISLSLCMIVRNEEAVLDRCLRYVYEIVDEIIIIDTGSTDKTKEIAQKYTSKIYDFNWCDNFAAARNYSFSKATKEYCMWLDADDVIDEYNCEKLKRLKETIKSDVDIVLMKYDVAFDEQGNPTMSYYRERIFKTAMDYKWVGAVHEVIQQYGKLYYADISVCHRKMYPNQPERNLLIYKRMIAEGTELDPRQLFYYARELFYNGYYQEAILKFTQFLSEGNGWIENNISACKDLSACLYHEGKYDAALIALFRSFAYDAPRAEICCDIGKHFMEQRDYRTAIFWFEIASSREKNAENGGFCMQDCYDYIPYMQLCLCYDRLGNREKSIYYNEKAGEIKPYDRNYLYNKEYFISSS